ncbi:MAG: 3-hydroxyacyl-CoA dehydrogenase family protein [Bacteroidales bacterium]|jgi:3-hydroxybutyryl-CoA dehydrogenase|nr:3-hydroxyacyl-CoA dehydrogenase family protein [Bacteroidales bacterium]
MNEIKVVGIIGSGKMGSDIFNYLSDFRYELIWFTRNPDHKETLGKTYHKKIKRQLKHGIISQEVFDLRFKYRITNNLSDFAQCDIIIESIIEEPDVKSEIFHQLDKIVKTSCILASNSSSILPSELSENVQRKNRVLGLHFFYPIAFKNVVELISSEFTDDISLEKAKLFLDDIKRFYLEQNEDSAFILNRILLQIQIVAFDIMKELGLGFKQFDDIAKQLVPDFGLFEMMDHVGHNTMYNAIMNYSKKDSDKMKYEPLLIELKKSNSDSGNNASNLFYDLDTDLKTITQEDANKILNKINETANKYLIEYSEKYHMNLFNLKKGLEELCGIML